MRSERNNAVRVVTDDLRQGRITRRQFMGRMVAAGVGLSAINAILAACAAVEAPADPSAVSTGSQDAAAEAPSLAGSEITATYMQSGTYDVAAETLKPTFESDTGITVNLVAAPFTVLVQRNITDLTTQTGEFDVMSLSLWEASAFQHLQPLDDLVARDGFGEDYIPALWAPGGSVFYGGQRVGVPYSADAYGVLYRSDLFEEAGVTADWETWDDLLAVAETLKGKLPDNVAPIVFSFGAPEQSTAIFYGAYPGTYVTAENTWAVERDLGAKALEVVQRVADYGPSDALALSIDEANAVFLQGKAAMIICWPSFIRAAADNPEQSAVVGKWQMGSFPGPGFIFLSAWNLAISKYSKNIEAAWEWIKAYTNPQNGKDFMTTYGIGSPFASTYEDAELLQMHSHDFPQQKANLNRTKGVALTFAAFEIQFRNMGEMMTGALTPTEVIERWHEGWAELTVPQALIELAEAQGQKAS